MPSQRKRIGFLPSIQVHEIIEQICSDKKISQSKVTGILVEEALKARGLMKSSYKAISKDTNNVISKVVLNSDNIYNFSENKYDEDLKMINDFIEYKFFKNIMNQNKKLSE